MTRHRILTAFVSSALAFAFFLFSGVASAEQKVAVIDVQRAVASTEDGLRAQATLKKLFDSRQQELNKKQTDLQRQREEIDKQAKVLPKDALEKRVDEWQKQMMELQADLRRVQQGAREEAEGAHRSGVREGDADHQAPRHDARTSTSSSTRPPSRTSAAISI